ncbi:MAG: PIN domain-containing protein [Thaumarchaeota archaeon]|jgi:predicted nucleic acid-binding protein|nr:PIN domain-containing protein [Candidatus Geocrenenecus arthurdayi]MCL7397342.1 PIN domain-containing protein [Candidatus Geocrenenecus arthurdayi]MCL7402156.1 PIN domain-containing protein [Candidatus Geocrenenecus arthurdayi]MCL7404212.1 PIN domain-containing protein [Candidatus Geocrenenecus arthurdayi]
MIYIDTNVIVSYVDEKDPYHDKVVNTSMQLDRERIVSQLTLLELASIYARAELEKPIPLAMYSIKRFGASIVEADLNIVMRESLRYVPMLRLKTLDLLHITIAKAVGAKSIATLDKDIAKKADLIKDTMAIEVITLHD